MKKALMIIAPKNFRDEELLEPKKILEEAGVKVTVTSTQSGTAKGMLGAQVTIDATADKLDAANYDAVIVVGGSGSPIYLWNNSEVQRIVKAAYEQGKTTSAICLSPAVLAKAGIAKGKRMTVFPASNAVNELKKAGAILTDAQVEVDGNIITAIGPEAAREFGKQIKKALGL